VNVTNQEGRNDGGSPHNTVIVADKQTHKHEFYVLLVVHLDITV